MIPQRAQVLRHRPSRGLQAGAPWSPIGGGGGVLRPLPGGPSRWWLAPPWPLDPWGLGRACFRASARLVVVVVRRPDSRSSPSWRPARQGCHSAALRRLMTTFPADRLRAMVVQVMVSLCAAAHYAAVAGFGWLLARPKAPGPSALVEKAPGLRPRSLARLLPWLLAGVGCCAPAPPAVAARAKTETDSVAILAQATAFGAEPRGTSFGSSQGQRCTSPPW